MFMKSPSAASGTGQKDLANTGLLDYNARMYSSELGRFLQPDTIVANWTYSQSWSRYSYVFNNPVKFNDPTGHDVGCPGIDAGMCSSYGTFSSETIRGKILTKHKELVKKVKKGKLTDLDALAQLSDFTAAFSPTDPTRFVENLGSVITGHSSGRAAIDEITAQIFNTSFDAWYLQVVEEGELMQTGYAEIFQDPGNIGGNQAHHFWFYVQVGFESGIMTGELGNGIHETILAKRGVGRSFQDYALGNVGAVIGGKLRSGELSPQDVGSTIITTLSLGSDEANLWERAIEIYGGGQ